MRVTENFRLRTISTNLAQLSERQAEAAREAGSGIRLDRVSTDPTAADQVTRLHASLTQAQTFRKNITAFHDNASKVESTLGQSMDLMARVREIALQGSNDSLNPENRATLAAEVLALRDQMLSLSNVKGTNGYLFSGYKSDVPAFDSAGNYQGDQNITQGEIAPGLAVAMTLTGDTAFTPPAGVNIFAELASLANDLQTAGASQIATHLTSIDTGLSQLSDTRSQAGLIMNRLDTADTSLEQSELGITKRQSSLVDADAFEAVSNLTNLNTTLQQAIGVARTTLNLNLERF